MGTMPAYFASHLGTNFWFPLFVIAVLEGIAIHTWRFREEPGARSLVYGQLCKGVWLLALLCGSRSTGLTALTAWTNLCWMASLLLLFVSYRFLVEMSGLDRELPAWITYLMGGTVGILWLIILTNGWHGWLWKIIWTDGDVARLLPGSGRQLPKIAGYLMGFITTGLCIRWLRSSTGLRRRQARLILLASLLSWFGHVLTFLPGCGILAPLPLSFLLSSTVTAWAFHRWRMYGIIPLAQEVVVKNMIDGLMVVDDRENIVSLNSTARAVFTNIVEGVPFQTAVKLWPALADLENEDGVTVREVCFGVEKYGRTFWVTMTPLLNSTGNRLGRVLLFKDVTQERQQQAQILEQQKAISTMMERQRLGRNCTMAPVRSGASFPCRRRRREPPSQNNDMNKRISAWSASSR
ncbi:histidine kinase N-terminal 7TM domain-containing protein [Telmatobacter bradus]|uniref:histidine kinase N-terminal 7TM domain-containing protein n=1 Tax=Telmatobacter bradus TaxID=474953 RepID=UPI003B42860A